MTIKLDPIREPYWGIKGIGVADSKITDDFIIECTFKTKDGKRKYPYPFLCRKGIAKVAPIKTIKGVDLRLIPFEKMTEVKDEQKTMAT
jgi:hypothetical protein